jgi:predicted MFS family arabinose efflux permease
MSSGTEQPSGLRAALRAPGFARLLAGQTVSSLGDWVATLAFIVAAFLLTGNQTAVAVVLILRLVPPIFAAPVGGVVADRLPRRTIMVTCDLIRAGLIVLVPFVGIVPLYAIAFVHECIGLFFLPARDSAVPSLVPATALPEANGLILATSYGALPLAAAAFALLSTAASNVPDWLPFADVLREHPTSFAFFFDAATFLFSALMIAGLPIRERAERQPIELFRDVAEGFRYGYQHPGLRSLAFALVVSMFGGGVLFALGISYIRETLGGSTTDFGWLAALWGAGMGLGLLVVRLVAKRGQGPVFLVAVVGCGAILVIMGALPYLWLAFIAAVAFGTTFAVAIMLALAMAQEMTDDRIRGRIMGVVQMLFRVGLGLGALGIGALASSVSEITIGVGSASVTLDGNQVGLIVGGALILLGAVASLGAARAAPEPQAEGLRGDPRGQGTEPA